MSRSICVTGGAGFLGSHLIDRLLADEPTASIICVDNLQTGSMKNLAHLNNRENFEFLQHDVTEILPLEVDEIWNFACAASPPRYQKAPVHTFMTSVFGCHRLANMALECDARLFHTSTSEVYGDPQVSPQKEDYWGHVNPIGPRSCYDEGKRAAETLLLDMQRQNGLEVRIVRIFNTYGPRMARDDGRVVSNFIVQALQGEDLTVYGDGSQTRSFCYVDDLIDACIKLMKTPQNDLGPINAGNPIEFTMIELAELVLKLTKSKSKIVFSELPVDDPQQRCPDISRAEEKLSWQPTVELEDGLKETISYFRFHLDN